MTKRKKTVEKGPAPDLQEVALAASEKEIPSLAIEDDLPEEDLPPENPEEALPECEIEPPEVLSPQNKKRYLNDESYRKTADRMLSSYRNFGKAWTDEERALLRKLYLEGASDEVLVAELGRTEKGIYLELLKMREARLSQ